MGATTICVRDVDPDIFRSFKSQSHQRGMTLGQALTAAIQHWTEEHRPKKRFLEFKPSKGWGKGTEKSSTEIDRVLYGKP